MDLTPGITGQGVEQFIPPSRMAAGEARFQAALEFAQKSDGHLWTAIVQHVIEDPAKFLAQGGHLDAESLANVVMGCYRCEQEYTPLTASRRCKGDA